MDAYAWKIEREVPEFDESRIAWVRAYNVPEAIKTWEAWARVVDLKPHTIISVTRSWKNPEDPIVITRGDVRHFAQLYARKYVRRVMSTLDDNGGAGTEDADPTEPQDRVCEKCLRFVSECGGEHE